MRQHTASPTRTPTAPAHTTRSPPSPYRACKLQGSAPPALVASPRSASRDARARPPPPPLSDVVKIGVVIYRDFFLKQGVMNGIDPVIIATGNDWRAIEAGAHAYAARDGRFFPMLTQTPLPHHALPLPLPRTCGLLCHPPSCLSPQSAGLRPFVCVCLCYCVCVCVRARVCACVSISAGVKLCVYRRARGGKGLRTRIT